MVDKDDDVDENDNDDNDDDDDDNDNDDDDEVYIDISLINIAFFIPAVVVKTTFEGSECIYNALIVHKVCVSVAPNAFCLPLNFRNFIAVSRVVLLFRFWATISILHLVSMPFQIC